MSHISPAVSVIIPALNAEKTLPEAVVSLRKQNYQTSKVQILVVNNGSVDRTEAVARELGVEVLNATPRNRAVARNVGIKAACGELLFFLDADCVASDNWITELAIVLKDPAVCAAQGTITPRGGRIRKYDEFSHAHLGMPFIDTKGCAIKRSLFDAIGTFNEDLTRCEDIDLGWRIALSGRTIFFSDDCGVVSGLPRGILQTLQRAFESAHGLLQVHRLWKQRLHLNFIKILGGFLQIGRREYIRRGRYSDLSLRIRLYYLLDNIATGLIYLFLYLFP